MNKIEIPENCGSCGGKLTTVNMQLYCTNISCSARVGRSIEHFVKHIGIKGLGEKTIQKLNISSIVDIYKLTLKDLTNLLGSAKLAEKLYMEIERSKTATLDKIIPAFGIPLIGKSAAALLLNVISDMDDITLQVCEKAGLGEKTTNNLMEFLEVDYCELKKQLPFSFANKGVNTYSIKDTVCITGKVDGFKNKSDVQAVLESNGYTVVDSVTKSTKYLIDESVSEVRSAKREKADIFGVKIISNFINFIGNTSNE